MNDETFESYEEEADFELIGDHETDGEDESSDNELDLAAELLTLSDDRELDQFLGNLIRKARGFAQGVMGTAAGQQLKGMLRGAAKKALPKFGQAIGSYIGGGRGGDIGAQAGNLAGSIFGLEAEGMSPEDRDFEVARQFVRFATSAAKQVANVPPGATPRDAAKKAFTTAARRYAPGLVTVIATGGSAGSSGTWRRKGDRIVLYNV